MSASKDIDVEVGRRLPLADSVLRLLNYALEDAFLDGVFQRHRGRCFERDLRFPVFVNLMADALLGQRGSAHQTFLHAQREERLTTSVQAVYDRLATLPCAVSVALLTEATVRLNGISVCKLEALPASLADYRALAIDGKKIKYLAKKLKPLRGLKGNVLGAKLVVAQDMASGQATAVEAAVDGETGDNPLVPGVLAQVRALPDPRPRLWVADRAYCDYKGLQRLSETGDAFVIRHAKCKFELDPAVPARTGSDDLKRPFRDECGWLGPSNRHRLRIRVRRITVERPGDEPLVLVTSLLDAVSYPAQDLLVLYRRRWGIETMFQRVVQTFDLRHLVGATPEATVFQAAFCLLLYNITLMICDYVAEGAQRPVEQLSLQLMHDDIVAELTAWMKVIGPDETPAVLQARTFAARADLRGYLRRNLANIWTDRLTKQKTVKRPPKKPPRAYLRGGHSSVDRILRGVHEEIPIKPHKPHKSPRETDHSRPNDTKESS